MPNVIIRPVSEHEVDTGDELPRLEPYLAADDFTALSAAAGGMPVRIHGRPASDRTRWDRIRVGDVVLFTGNGKAFQKGEVLWKWISEAVSDDLWPRTEEDVENEAGPWSLLFAIGKIAPVDLPYAKLNAISGDSPKYVPQGFRVMNDERSARVIAALGAHP